MDICVIERDALRTSKALLPESYYQFDFATQIPDGVPGSLDFDYGRPCGSCSLLFFAAAEYWLEAKLVGPGGEKNALARTAVNVLQHVKPPEIVAPSLLQNQIVPAVTCCCCCRAGSVTISMQLEKNVFFLGETARVSYRIDGRAAPSPIKSVVIDLVQIVNMRKRDGKSYTCMVSLLGVEEPGLGRNGGMANS